MPTPDDSPIFRFLTDKENLRPVLEVVRYAEEVRGYVATRFWNRLEESIKKNPNAIANLNWEQGFPAKPEEESFLIARPLPLGDKGQGLRYRIEAATDYFGFGLSWNEDAREPEKLCQIQSLKVVQSKLLKNRRGDIESEPNRWWLWWEYWQHNPYPDDPWIWFSKDFGDGWFDDLAHKFWEFVVPINPLVIEANKSLKRRSS